MLGSEFSANWRRHRQWMLAANEGSARRPGRHVEQQDLRVFQRFDPDPGKIIDRCPVALLDRLSIQSDATASHLQPAYAAGSELMCELCVGCDARDVQIDILVNKHRVIAAVGGCDEPQVAVELLGETPLLVAGLQALLRG